MPARGTAETERFHRQVLRYVMTGLAAVLGSGVILGLVQANVQEWAKANSQDQYIVKYARPIVDRLAELTQSSAFFAIAWAVIGGAAILWIDYTIRRRTKKMALALYIIALTLAGLATWILFQPAKQTESTQSSQSNISDAAKAAIIAPFQAQIDELRNQIASIPRQNPTGGYWSSRKPEQPVEREFTKRTVRELRAIYEGRTSLQADAFMADEKGRLIETEGTVMNVDSGMAFLKIGDNPPNTDHVECRFGSQWNAKLGTFRRGELMKIRGVIGPNQNGAQIYLQECEIIG